MSRGYFITGTDTGVGKTVITAALLSALRARGRRATVMKPVQTGCILRAGSLVAPDVEFCLRAADWAPPADELARINPYRYARACSPHLAARLEGPDISVPEIMSRFHELSEAYETVLVEGAGGLQVPLGFGQSMLTLLANMELPVVLVARSGLGTINHCMLSIAALRDAEVEIAGIVFNDANDKQDEEITADNIAMIEAEAGVPALLRFPQVANVENGDVLRPIGDQILSALGTD